ncbi:MAG: NAD-dependent epimerase/dehydratase family protein [Bacteroidetes bacterium]|nr:NAD-dependent epimerase/dehydratase family protein [Bacteroidota bacterium]
MILVTGATGFIGSHLLIDLLKSGKKVRAIRRNGKSDLTTKIFSFYNCSKLLSEVEWFEGDVLDFFSLIDALDGISEVYHCAAIVSFHKTEALNMEKVNIQGTANIVNAALEKKINKLCYVSSIAALGRSETDLPTDEETFWKSSKRNSAYSISKYGAEREVWRGTIEGLDAVIVNPSVVIGPGNWKKGSSQLFSLMDKGLKFYTMGMNGYVDVRDVSKAMILLMESEIKNERFILSSENLFCKDFFDQVADGLGKKRPSKKAGKFLSQIAWRYLKFIEIFTGKKASITKETARTANNISKFSSEKIIKAIDFKFIPMYQSIKDTCEIYLREKN